MSDKFMSASTIGTAKAHHAATVARRGCRRAAQSHQSTQPKRQDSHGQVGLSGRLRFRPQYDDLARRALVYESNESGCAADRRAVHEARSRRPGQRSHRCEIDRSSRYSLSPGFCIELIAVSPWLDDGGTAWVCRLAGQRMKVADNLTRHFLHTTGNRIT